MIESRMWAAVALSVLVYGPSFAQLPHDHGAASDEQLGVVRVCRLTGKEASQVKDLQEHDDPVHGLAFSPDSKVLAWTHWGKSRSIVFWDVMTGKVRGTIRMPVELRDLVFAADGQHVMVTAGNGAGYVVRVPLR